VLTKSPDLPLPPVTAPHSERRQYEAVHGNTTLRTNNNFLPGNVAVEIAKRNVSVPPPAELLGTPVNPSVLPITFVLARQHDLDAKLLLSWRTKIYYWLLGCMLGCMIFGPSISVSQMLYSSC